MPQEWLSGSFGIVTSLLLFVLFLLWFFLPFAIFGTKARLDELIQQNKKLIQCVESLNAEVAVIRRNSSGSANTTTESAEAASDT